MYETVVSNTKTSSMAMDRMSLVPELIVYVQSAFTRGMRCRLTGTSQEMSDWLLLKKVPISEGSSSDEMALCGLGSP